MVATVQDEPDSGYVRLEQQIAWYDSKSGAAQRAFKRTRLVQVVLTASVPLLAFTTNISWLHSWALAAVGAAGLVLEAVQQINQWQHNWITYRSTCEALRHEKYTYLGSVGPYDEDEPTTRKKLLIERVESLISTEHSKWVGRLENERHSSSLKRQGNFEREKPT